MEQPLELNKAVEFHGHLCPGLVIGYRAALMAMWELGITRAQDEELVATVYTDSCAVDAVQVLTGCTFGKGNLRFRDLGKHVFLFARQGSGQWLRLALRHDGWGQAGDRVKLVRTLLRLPESSLFSVRQVPMEPSRPANIFATIECAFCGEGVMEPRARVREGKYACLECAEA